MTKNNLEDYISSYAPFNVVSLNKTDNQDADSTPNHDFIPMGSLLELLEVLHPEDEFYSNLNSAYVSRDINTIFNLVETVNNNPLNKDLKNFITTGDVNSLFKLFPNSNIKDYHSEENLYEILTHIGTTEEEIDIANNLKGAYLDKNYYSIFRLLPNANDLKKTILNDDYWALFRFLKLKADQILLESNAENLWKLGKTNDNLAPNSSRLLFSLKSLYVNNVKFDYNIFNKTKILNYRWVVNELQKLNMDLKTVFLCCASHGILSVMLFENQIKMLKIRGIDYDPNIYSIAEIINKPYVVNNWKFKSVCEDIRYVDYDKQYDYYVSRTDGSQVLLVDTCNTVININCEHLDDFEKWYSKIPSNITLVLQIDSSQSTSFNELAHMTTVCYEGTYNNRFMKIGVK